MEIGEGINHIIDFFNKIPIINKFIGGRYRAYGLKKCAYMIGPIISLIIQVIKSALGYFMALSLAGAILWLIKTPGSFDTKLINQFWDLALDNYAVLSFYLALALISNYIAGNKSSIHKLNRQLKMDPKDAGLIYGLFGPLRLGLGRGFGFAIFMGLETGLLISLSLSFIRVIATAINLKLEDKSKKTNDRLWPFFLFLILSFAILKEISHIDLGILLAIFTLSLFILVFAIRYLFAYDSYGGLLENASLEDLNIDVDVDKIANDSVALEDEDLDYRVDYKERGYEFLNKLFFNRHRRLIVKPTIKKSAIMLGLILTGLIGFKYVFTDLGAKIPNAFFLALPIIIMIIFNNSTANRAFFLNCDRSLMQYGFYKDASAINKMFWLRFKILLKINVPGFLVALIGLFVYYALYQGGLSLEILGPSAYILASYIFYVAFNLGAYYLCQPFNYEASLVGGAYKFLTSIIGYINTVIIPLVFVKLDGNTSLAFLLLAGVMLILVPIIGILVKIYGPRTFRIKK